MKVKEGARLGKYELVRCIDEGGIGDIWQATQDGQDKVAIKIIASAVSTPSCTNLLAEQARVGTELNRNHPNLINMFGFAEHQGLHYLVMEYVHGRSAHEIVERSRKLEQVLSPQFCVQVILDCCRGLQFIHDYAGVVHCDLGPGNIMVSRSGVPKIIDFGVSYQQSNGVITQGLVEKIHFLSPERLRNQTTDARSDVYSLSIVLYQMLTQKLPFSASSDTEISEQILAGEAALPSEFVEVDMDLEIIVLQAMASDPQERYQSAEVFAEALQDWLSQRSESPEDASDVMTLLFPEGRAHTITGDLDITPRKVERVASKVPPHDDFALRAPQSTPTSGSEPFPPSGALSDTAIELGSSFPKKTVGMALLAAVALGAFLLVGGSNASESVVSELEQTEPVAVATPTPSDPIESPETALHEIYAQAQTLSAKGDVEQALALLGALQSQPAGESDDYDKAKLLEKTLLVDRQMQLATQLAEQSHIGDALTELDKALEILPGHAPALSLQEVLREQAKTKKHGERGKIVANIRRAKVQPKLKPELTKAPAPPPKIKPPVVTTNKEKAFASLFVASTPPSAKLYLDGKFRGFTPQNGLALPPGKHKIVLELEGMHRYSKDLNVKAGERRLVEAALKPLKVATAVPKPPTDSGNKKSAAVAIPGLSLPKKVTIPVSVDGKASPHLKAVCSAIERTVSKAMGSSAKGSTNALIRYLVEEKGGNTVTLYPRTIGYIIAKGVRDGMTNKISKSLVHYQRTGKIEALARKNWRP